MANRGDIKAGGAFIELFLKKNMLEKGLLAVEARMKALGSGLTSIGLKMMAGGSAMLAPLLAATHAFTEAGDAADKMAQRTGMTAESITQLASAAEMSGLSIEDIESSFRKYQKTLAAAASGNKEATQTLLDLGLSVEQLEAMSPDEQFEALADAVSKVEGPTNRANAAMAVFGKSGTVLLPMLEGGAEGLRELKQQAIDLGIAMDSQAIEAAVELDDAVDALKGSAVGLGRSLGSALAPMLTELAKVSTACIATFSKFIREHGDVVRSVAKGAAAIVAGGAGAFVLGKMFILASGAVGFLTPALVALASPIGIVTGLILGGAVAWMKWSDSGKKAAAGVASIATKIRDYFGTLFGDMSETAGSTWKGIVDAVSSGDLALAGEVAWAGLKLVWHQGTNDLYKVWANVKWYVLTVWNEATTGIAKGFYAVLGQLETGWVTCVKFLKDVWNGLSTFVLSKQQIWGKAIGDTIISAAEGVGIITPEFAKAWRDTLKSQTEQNLADITTKSEDFQAKADAEAARRTEAINKRTEGLTGILDEDKKRKQGEIDSNYEKSLKEKESALDEARRRFNELKTKTDALAASRIRPAIGGGGESEELTRRAGSVSGSFFAAAFAGMGGSGSTQERIAKAAEKSRDLQKQQLDASLKMLEKLDQYRTNWA